MPLRDLGAAMLQQLREGMILAQQDVGKALVVAIADIVARLQPLDQVGFQQQRFGLGRGGDEQHLRRLGDHARDAVGVAGRLGIGRDALLQALGLADIEHVALGIQHAIDARRVGQGLQIGRDALRALQRGVVGLACGASRRRCCGIFVHGALI